jgi:hypothetical protein
LTAAKQEIHRARRSIITALLSGQTEVLADPTSARTPINLEVSPEGPEELQRIMFARLFLHRVISLRIYRRTWPLLGDHVPQSVPAWARF